MSEKNNFIRLLGYLFGAVMAGIAVAVFIFCVDPFYHYHKAWFGIPTVLENAVYQTPGAARHLEYDSVILGTSMTENFRVSWFDELGWDTVKLSYSGARTDDLKAIMGQVFEREDLPRHIVMDINDYQLTVPAWTAYVERPQYLYTESLADDIPYLYSFDVFTISLERILDKLQGRKSNLEEAYTWEDEEYFGKKAVLTYTAPAIQALSEQENEGRSLESLIEICDQNLNNITDFIEENPETEFYIFYPPYSILYWEEKMLNNELEQMLEMYKHSMQRLNQYENVKIYYFQNDFEKISDLEQYRDESHYSPEYNRYIFESIRDGNRLVTQENLEEYVESMYLYALNYDYEALWRDFREEAPIDEQR